jgi:hypothetical protein
MDTRRLETAYRRGNLDAAGVILEDIAKYGGEESGLVKWARLVTHSTDETQPGRGDEFELTADAKVDQG